MILREKYCRGLRQYFIDVSGDRVIIVQSSDNDLKAADLGEKTFILADHENEITAKDIVLGWNNIFINDS